jgi:SAM-dependent methyltransferase
MVLLLGAQAHDAVSRDTEDWRMRIRFAKESGISRTISDKVCPVCRETGEHNLFAVVEARAITYDLYQCPTCDLLIYVPLPSIDYERHTDSEFAFRNYVEMNASIDCIGNNILRAIRPGSSGSLLDVGCGFGFGMDVVRRLAGWRVLGFEPSSYGKEGARLLRLPLRDEELSRNESGEMYDIVHASEVIEHVEDPREFVTLLTSHLAENGILVLTTPDARRIKPSALESILMALLSPGAHTFLFSSRAIRMLMDDVGLRHQKITHSGDSLLIYASRSAFRLHDVDKWSGWLTTYLEQALLDVDRDSPLGIGLMYRLYAALINESDYTKAEDLETLLPMPVSLETSGIDTIEQFADRFPLCTPALVYYRAMHLLNGKKDYRNAAVLFGKCHVLCKCRIELEPATAIVESGMVWKARFYEVVALFKSGDVSSASRCAKAIWQARDDPRYLAIGLSGVSYLLRRLMLKTGATGRMILRIGRSIRTRFSGC